MSITMDPLGTHPYLRENSGESQEHVHIHNIFNCYLYRRDISIQGKGTLFLGPETRH